MNVQNPLALVLDAIRFFKHRVMLDTISDEVLCDIALRCEVLACDKSVDHQISVRGSHTMILEPVQGNDGLHNIHDKDKADISNSARSI